MRGKYDLGGIDTQLYTVILKKNRWPRIFA